MLLTLLLQSGQLILLFDTLLPVPVRQLLGLLQLDLELTDVSQRCLGGGGGNRIFKTAKVKKRIISCKIEVLLLIISTVN